MRNVMPRAEPVRLWLLSYNFRPVWAGPAERFLRYAAGLRRRGVDMRFVTVMRPGQAREEVIDGTALVRLGRAGAQADSVHRFNAAVMRHALAARPRPDVLLYIGISPADVAFCWVLRAAGIATMHVSTMARERTRAPWRQWVVDRALYAVERSYDRIITSSAALRAEHDALGVPPARLAVIPNGVSLARFRPPAGPDEVRALRARLELPAGEPIALFVGPIVDRKGLVELVEAWRRHRARGGPGRLLLVGAEYRDDPLCAAFYERWDALMAGVGPGDRIERRPPHVAIEDYYRAADLFVFLSRLEGMPNVLPESMACGLAVVTTRFQGFSPELGRDGSELVITGREPDDISRRIGELLADEPRRRALGASARAWVEAHHDVERSLDDYAALCRRVAGELRPWHRGRLPWT